jgi:hypothetical protein
MTISNSSNPAASTTPNSDAQLAAAVQAILGGVQANNTASASSQVSKSTDTKVTRLNFA